MQETKTLPRLLVNVYPEMKWDRQRFRLEARRRKKEKLMAALAKIEQEMGIQKVINLLPELH